MWISLTPDFSCYLTPGELTILFKITFIFQINILQDDAYIHAVTCKLP